MTVVDETNQTENTQGYILLLSEAQAGWRVEVVGYLSNGKRSQRLAELGLTPGTPVYILRCARSQPILVCVRGTHLAIDRKTAACMRVRIIRRRRRHGRGPRGWRRRWREHRHGHICGSD
jgi:Fe2+ transport system protein FeoA